MSIEDSPVNKFDDHTILVLMYDEMQKMDKKYVCKAEFDPVKRIAFGLVGLICVAVAGGLLKLII